MCVCECVKYETRMQYSLTNVRVQTTHVYQRPLSGICGLSRRCSTTHVDVNRRLWYGHRGVSTRLHDTHVVCASLRKGELGDDTTGVCPICTLRQRHIKSGRKRTGSPGKFDGTRRRKDENGSCRVTRGCGHRHPDQRHGHGCLHG